MLACCVNSGQLFDLILSTAKTPILFHPGKQAAL